ncbi:MAG: hypothetical protein A3F14_00980 [Gammaproteobacteria bacterium RIFCSPHIGHO2_12_FULL_43_28]|nr:MAG: hypothetical protein A3F14_00980 [Gammaproteobacteria bacterium RIFCSPHIGHO2_12_FULL_43_28]
MKNSITQGKNESHLAKGSNQQDQQEEILVLRPSKQDLLQLQSKIGSLRKTETRRARQEKRQLKINQEKIKETDQKIHSLIEKQSFSPEIELSTEDLAPLENLENILTNLKRKLNYYTHLRKRSEEAFASLPIINIGELPTELQSIKKDITEKTLYYYREKIEVEKIKLQRTKVRYEHYKHLKENLKIIMNLFYDHQKSFFEKFQAFEITIKNIQKTLIKMGYAVTQEKNRLEQALGERQQQALEPISLPQQTKKDFFAKTYSTVLGRLEPLPEKKKREFTVVENNNEQDSSSCSPAPPQNKKIKPSAPRLCPSSLNMQKAYVFRYATPNAL